jgi:hypothetical protein
VKPWQAQKFLGDVVYDLRNRNMLPVVVMLLLAIVAVPVLVSRSGSSDSPSTLGLGASTSAGSTPENESAVVAYHPGVRDYRQRLNDLTPKDPFVQQGTSASSSSTSSSSDQLAQAVSGSSASSGSGVGGGSTPSGGGGGGSTKVTHHVTYFWWESDVQMGEAGTQLAEQDSVKPFQFLPSSDKPVLTYMGTVGGHQAVFLVSQEVAGVGGQGTCFPSVDACQLLGIDAGKGADLTYQPDGKTYHVQVLRVRRVTGSKPPNF